MKHPSCAERCQLAEDKGYPPCPGECFYDLLEQEAERGTGLPDREAISLSVPPRPPELTRRGVSTGVDMDQQLAHFCDQLQLQQDIEQALARAAEGKASSEDIRLLAYAAGVNYTPKEGNHVSQR